MDLLFSPMGGALDRASKRVIMVVHYKKEDQD
jgi:hypothetical protein